MEDNIEMYLQAAFEKLDGGAVKRSDYTRCIREFLDILAPAIGIAAVHFEYKGDKNTYSRIDVGVVDEWYRQPGVARSEKAYFIEKKLPSGSSIKSEFYPILGVIWNIVAKRRLDFVSNLLILYASRGRVYELLDCALHYEREFHTLSREGITDYAKEIIKQGDIEKYTMFFFNVVNMSYYNHRYGRVGGDHILHEYTLRIRALLGRDGVLGRIGGDTFAILVYSERVEELLAQLQRLKVVFRVNRENTTVYIAARVGLYKFEKNDRIEEAWECVNLAYRETKRSSGASYCFYNHEVREQEDEKQELQKRIKRGLLLKEFVPYYQPKVNAGTLTLCGAEALVRWKVNGEIIPPGKFIPAMETNGSICTLDFVIFDQVCHQIQRWLKAGIEPVRISVNFSREHLANPNLVEQIMQTVKKYNVDATKYLEIEITESSCYQDFEALIKFVKDIREEGVHVSIDDFGTGFSSLNLLSALTVDTIKLDKSFLDHVDSGDNKDRVLFTNIVRMIEELQLDTISEGVERKEQVEFLRSLHCTKMQGFYFDRPLAKEEFEERLRHPNYYTERKE